MAEPVNHSAALFNLTRLLLDERNEQGWWTGELSTSALSTATACMALNLAIRSSEGGAAEWKQLLENGLQWLADNQNADGGWGDTVLSISNISTTMLANAVLVAACPILAPQLANAFDEAISRSRNWITDAGGVAAVLRRYGTDHTFSVPILTHCALAGIVDWKQVIPLPFELACVPARFYAAVRMPVVSYALPALIAIGQVIFRHRGHWNPLMSAIRRISIRPTLKVLESIQPSHGGFLEATPLTSFVCMSLLGCGLHDHPVTQRCLEFIERSVRPDGSWPIDTNLSTWVTTLSLNALSSLPDWDDQLSGDPVDESVPKTTDIEPIRQWLLNQQYKSVHPYTNADPGGWSWTDLPGGVPDADDTPGAMLAIMNLRPSHDSFSADERKALRNAAVWLLDLQNRDGGWPTFCRGWGKLPFDRSSCDITAHVVRALFKWQNRCPEDASAVKLTERSYRAISAGLGFLKSQQSPDGTWLPLWFGHQFNANDENPLYGTAKIVTALGDLAVGSGRFAEEAMALARPAVLWLLQNQNVDGGWSARRGLESSVEETGIALEALVCDPLLDDSGMSTDKIRCVLDAGANWLACRVNEGTVQSASPIGFYFAKLWYFERLYPTIFALGGLAKWQNWAKRKVATGGNAPG